MLKESTPFLFVDVQSLQQPVAYKLEHGVDGLWLGILEGDGSPRALIVPPGGTDPLNDIAEHFAGMIAELRHACRDLHEVAEKTNRERPVHLIEPDEKVSDLGDDVGLSDDAAPTYDDILVKKRVRQGMLKRGEVALRQLGIADLRQKILVGPWE